MMLAAKWTRSPPSVFPTWCQINSIIHQRQRYEATGSRQQQKMALFELDGGWITDKKTDKLNDSLFGEVHPLANMKQNPKKKKRKQQEDNMKNSNHGNMEGQSANKLVKMKHGKRKMVQNEDSTTQNEKHVKRIKQEHGKASIGSREQGENLTLGTAEVKKGRNRQNVTNEVETTKMSKKQKHKQLMLSPHLTGVGKKQIEKQNNMVAGSPTESTVLESPTKRRRNKKLNNKRNKYKHLAGIPKSNTATAVLPTHGTESTDSTQHLQSSDSFNVISTHGPDVQQKAKRKKTVPAKSDRETKSNSNQTLSTPNLQKKKKMQKVAVKVQKLGERGKLKSFSDIERLKQVLGWSADRRSVSDKTSLNVQQEDSMEKKVKKKAPQSLNERMRQQLNAARFRYLNEQLYTQSGEEALQLFSEDQEAFEVYHEGFQSQVDKWPVNPVQRMISYIMKRPQSHVVADFGCGDAKIARGVPHKVHSFDLVALNDHVTVCDVADVPLDDESVDIGVFCLALMGTNLVDFLAESNRVLKTGGTLLVAEVVSRFEKVGSFVRKMEKLGFTLKEKNDSNKMFIWFEFKKTGDPKTASLPQIELMPCIYKKR